MQTEDCSWRNLEHELEQTRRGSGEFISENAKANCDDRRSEETYQWQYRNTLVS